ncbi:MAG: hypothetical protein IPI44_09245 [Sulfuritalea sp.]|nr:hypothetical protein [Sulfuritalea sp.]
MPPAGSAFKNWSAEYFGTVAVLGNKLSHHSPEEASLRIERLNLVMAEAEYVFSMFDDIMAFLIRKGFVSSGGRALEVDK